MKTVPAIMKIFSAALLSLLVFTVCCQATAQEKSDKKEKYKIKIVEIEDGKQKIIKEEFQNKEAMEEFLEKHNKNNIISEDISIDTDSGKKKHRVMILKKEGGDSEDREIIIQGLSDAHGIHGFKDGDNKIIIKRDGKEIDINGFDFNFEMPEIEKHLKHLEYWTDKDYGFHFERHGGKDVTFDADLPENIRQITKKSDKLEVEGFSFHSDKETVGAYIIEFDAEGKKSLTVEVFDKEGKNVFKDNIGKLDGKYEGVVSFAGKSKGQYFVKITAKGETTIKKVHVR